MIEQTKPNVANPSLKKILLQGRLKYLFIFSTAIVTLVFFYSTSNSITNIKPPVSISPTRDDNPVLDIVKTSFTKESEFDVIVRNLGETDLIIHKITITKLEDPGSRVAPILSPTAKYHLPVNGIPVGGNKLSNI